MADVSVAPRPAALLGVCWSATTGAARCGPAVARGVLLHALWSGQLHTDLSGPLSSGHVLERAA